jgi:CTP synthase (UTP-ammonia lyase)
VRAPLISLLIDLAPGQQYHAATLTALEHASERQRVLVEVRVVPTETIDRRVVADPGTAVVIGPGSPYRNPDGVLEVVRSARERGIPLVAT